MLLRVNTMPHSSLSLRVPDARQMINNKRWVDWCSLSPGPLAYLVASWPLPNWAHCLEESWLPASLSRLEQGAAHKTWSLLYPSCSETPVPGERDSLREPSQSQLKWQDRSFMEIEPSWNTPSSSHNPKSNEHHQFCKYLIKVQWLDKYQLLLDTVPGVSTQQAKLRTH